LTGDKWEAARAVSAKVLSDKADDFAEDMRTELILNAGGSATGTAKNLNKAGVPGARGTVGTWTARAVLNVEARIAAVEEAKRLAVFEHGREEYARLTDTPEKYKEYWDHWLKEGLDDLGDELGGRRSAWSTVGQYREPSVKNMGNGKEPPPMSPEDLERFKKKLAAADRNQAKAKTKYEQQKEEYFRLSGEKGSEQYKQYWKDRNAAQKVRDIARKGRKAAQEVKDAAKKAARDAVIKEILAMPKEERTAEESRLYALSQTKDPGHKKAEGKWLLFREAYKKEWRRKH
jgi:hypothetical protein